MNVTTILNGAYSKNGGTSTVTLSGAAITSSVLVDGLQIEGAVGAAEPDSSRAVSVVSNAAPIVRDCQIIGGSVGTDDGMGKVLSGKSSGVYIASGASPQIEFDLIAGGSGNPECTGILLDVDTGNPSIHDDTISVAASCASDHVGIHTFAASSVMTVANGNPIQNNVIALPASTSNTVNDYGFRSVDGAGGAIDLVSNLIQRGNVANVSGARTAAVFVDGPTGPVVTIARNILAAADGGDQAYGVYKDASGTVVENNFIYGGDEAATGGDTYGVYFDYEVTSGAVEHDTIYGGGATGASGPVSAAVAVEGTGVSITNDIFFGSGQANGLGVLMVSYSGACPTLEKLENNLFVGFASGLVLIPACSGIQQVVAATIDNLAPDFTATNPATVVQGNIVIRASCTTDAGAETGCHVGSRGADPASVIAAFDDTTMGYKNLFPPSGTPGWLMDGDPCPVVASSLNDSASIPVDFYGNVRAAKPSMGAAQDDTTNCTP